jgi:hypothetical protein
MFSDGSELEQYLELDHHRNKIDLPPERIAGFLGSGFNRLTLNNGDGTFTHELHISDPDWPSVIEL